MNIEALINWKSINIYTKMERLQLFNDINLLIDKGDWITIIGHNGSGKSTLAQTISGHFNERYVVEGKEQFRHKDTYPMLIQTTSEYLLGSTPYEDLIIAYEQYGAGQAEADQIEQSIDHILEKLNIAHLKHTDTALLSGGEKQLVALAGCLMMEAELIIFDEITSMLAPETREATLMLIRELWEEKKFAVLWITQLAEELKHSDRVWVMQSNQLMYDGSAAELYSDKTQPPIAVQLQLEVPWSVKKAKQLRDTGVALPHIPFHVTELAKLVKQFEHSTAAK